MAIFIPEQRSRHHARIEDQKIKSALSLEKSRGKGFDRNGIDQVNGPNLYPANPTQSGPGGDRV
ncbi:hypothetical protein SAMCCGM7_pC2071 (plasmid) [Sinorhizobium americanum CCGM7]|nr:hypothetical protein SAMCCGM7_pC2071 [Sinorhizobium americanum CCGM7]